MASGACELTCLLIAEGKNPLQFNFKSHHNWITQTTNQRISHRKWGRGALPPSKGPLGLGRELYPEAPAVMYPGLPQPSHL